MTFKIITDKNLSYKHYINKIKQEFKENDDLINRTDIKELEIILKKFKSSYSKSEYNYNYNTNKNYFSNDKNCNNIKIFDNYFSSNMSRNYNSNSTNSITYGPRVF